LIGGDHGQCAAVFVGQHAARPGTGPLDNLADHLKAPFSTTFMDNGGKYLDGLLLSDDGGVLAPARVVPRLKINPNS
jgi:hypothetical protein